MRSTFKKLFNVTDDCLDTSAIQTWMTDAPIGIVEYDGILQPEVSRDRDKRMEIVEVYDGDISELVSYLRSIYTDYRSLTKWELIFTIYNDIMTAQKPIEQALSQVVFGSNNKSEVEGSPKEEPQVDLDSSSEDSTVEEVIPDVEHVEEAEPIEEDMGATSYSNAIPETPIKSASELNQTIQEDSPTEVSDVSSGNVQDGGSVSLYTTNNNIINPKEDKNMASAIDELKAAASKGAVQSDPSQVQKAPASSNVASKSVDAETKAKVAEVLASTKEERNAWTRQNTVTAIISTQKPAALRLIGEPMGVAAPGITDVDEARTEVTKKINKFIVSVSGQENMTEDVFETLPDAQKYANVVPKEGAVTKAAAMYALYKTLKQNPLEAVAAFVPAADKLSYPTKGYMIGSTPYPEQEFILQLMDNGTGAIYGIGSVDENGNDVGDKPVIFNVGIASRVEKAISKGVSTQKKTNQVPVVRPKNKKEFIADGSHIQFLFTQVAMDAEGKPVQGAASFKAAVNVGGELQPATVSVYALENGQKQQRSVKEDGTVTYKTKVASINVSVPVTKVKKEFEASFRGADEDILVTAGRWGVQMRVDAQKGNFGNISEFSSAPILDVFAKIYAGNVKLSDTLRSGSESIKALQAAANQQAEEDAKASADELE